MSNRMGVVQREDQRVSDHRMAGQVPTPTTVCETVLLWGGVLVWVCTCAPLTLWFCLNIFVSSEQNGHQKPPQPKPLMKQPLPPATKPASTTFPAVAPKVALLPPTKQGVKPPPLPPPKATQKVLPTPPVPPPKPPNLASDLEKLQPSNGVHGPPSPLTLSDDAESSKEDEEEEPRSDLEVGSMVEVNDPPLYGVIRWIGRISGVPETVAGIELVRMFSS